mgnify:CR=1 FL=1
MTGRARWVRRTASKRPIAVTGAEVRVEPDQLDVSRFSRVVTAQHQRLAPVAGLVPGPDRAGLDPGPRPEAPAGRETRLTWGLMMDMGSS